MNPVKKQNLKTNRWIFREWRPVLLLLFFPTLLWAQTGRQDYEVIRELREDKKLYVVVGNGKLSQTKPGNFFAEFRTIFESEWRFCKYEIITRDEAVKLGGDTNLFFLRLSQDYSRDLFGAAARLSKGYQKDLNRMLFPHLQHPEIIQYSMGYDKTRNALECKGQVCLRPTLRLLVRSVQAYLQTAYAIEDARFEAVAWANREKLATATWLVDRDTIAEGILEDGTFQKRCPIPVAFRDFRTEPLALTGKEWKESQVALVHFNHVDQSTNGNWDSHLISLSGDLLFYHPFREGDRLLLPYPHVNTAFLEALSAWMVKESLND